MSEDWEQVSPRKSKRNNRRPRHPSGRQREGETRTYNTPPRRNALPLGTNHKELSMKPHFLMLMGLPGSGKSTLAVQLEKMASSRRYRRINQDETGNRKACLNAAERAWNSQNSPIIDRCNANPAQRKHFCNLAAKLGAPVHLVVLEVDPQVCLQRARARQNHPTVTPAMAAKVIGFMQADWELPLPAEGFQSVTICKTEKDIQTFLQKLLASPPEATAEAQVDQTKHVEDDQAEGNNT